VQSVRDGKYGRLGDYLEYNTKTIGADKVDRSDGRNLEFDGNGLANGAGESEYGV